MQRIWIWAGSGLPLVWPWIISCLLPVQRAASGWGWKRRPSAPYVWRRCWRRPRKAKVRGLKWTDADLRGRCFYTREWESAPKRPSMKCSPATRLTTSSEVLYSSNVTWSIYLLYIFSIYSFIIDNTDSDSHLLISPGHFQLVVVANRCFSGHKLALLGPTPQNLNRNIY